MGFALHPIFLIMAVILLVFIVSLVFSFRALNRGSGHKIIILSALLTFILTAFIAYFSYTLDQYIGMGAYKLHYLIFIFFVAVFMAIIWRKKMKVYSVTLGLLVFIILYFSVYAHNPSERILRSIQLKLKPGSEASSIDEVVKKTYDNTGYELPGIEKEKNRIHVSLLSQKPGNNCTALTFHIKDGIIIDSSFSPD